MSLKFLIIFIFCHFQFSAGQFHEAQDVDNPKNEDNNSRNGQGPQPNPFDGPQPCLQYSPLRPEQQQQKQQPNQVPIFAQTPQDLAPMTPHTPVGPEVEKDTERNPNAPVAAPEREHDAESRSSSAAKGDDAYAPKPPPRPRVLPTIPPYVIGDRVDAPGSPDCGKVGTRYPSENCDAQRLGGYDRPGTNSQPGTYSQFRGYPTLGNYPQPALNPQSGTYPQPGINSLFGNYPQPGTNPQLGRYPNSGANPQFGQYPSNNPQLGMYPQAGNYQQSWTNPQLGRYAQPGAYPHLGGYSHSGGYPRLGNFGNYANAQDQNNIQIGNYARTDGNSPGYAMKENYQKNSKYLQPEYYPQGNYAKSEGPSVKAGESYAHPNLSPKIVGNNQDCVCVPGQQISTSYANSYTNTASYAQRPQPTASQSSYATSPPLGQEPIRPVVGASLPPPPLNNCCARCDRRCAASLHSEKSRAFVAKTKDSDEEEELEVNDCTTPALNAIIKNSAHLSMTQAKIKIQEMAELELEGGIFHVICAAAKLEYVTRSFVFCAGDVSDGTCYAFQTSL